MKKPTTVYNWDKLPLALDVATVAVILGNDPCTINRKCREGLLPARKVGRTWHVDRDRLRAMLGQGNPSVAMESDQIEAIAQRVAEIVLAQLKGASA